MATRIIQATCDLLKPIGLEGFPGALFENDNTSDEFHINVCRGSEPVSLLSGAVSATFIRIKDGQRLEEGDTVTIVGSASNDIAIVKLPEACYAYPGRFVLTVKYTEAANMRTIFACEGVILQSATQQYIDPGSTIPDVEELLAQIAGIEAAASNANTAAANATSSASNADKAATRANNAAATIEGTDEYIRNLTVAATKVASTAPAKATVSDVDDHLHIAFDIPQGDKGNTGATPKLSVKATETTAPGTKANVTISGTPEAPELTFQIPEGQKGTTGDTGAQGIQGPVGKTPKISVKATETLEPGEQANVVLGGTDEAPELTFQIPEGRKGETGNTGAQGPVGKTPSISVVATETLAPGEQAAVELGGTDEAPELTFKIPEGRKGEIGNTGAKGDTGATPVISIGDTVTLPPGSKAKVTITGEPETPTMTFEIPQGDTGKLENFSIELTGDATGRADGSSGNVRVPAKLTHLASSRDESYTIVTGIPEDSSAGANTVDKLDVGVTAAGKPIMRRWSGDTSTLINLYSDASQPPYPVTKVNGKTGEVTIDAASLGAVTTKTTVNGHALSENVTITAADVGAVPTTRKINGHVLSADFSITAADVGALASSAWVVNSATANGYVSAGTGHNNMVWKTDGDGVPGWRADANTTYNVFGKASTDAAGTTGLVPAPAKGDQAKFLRADGSWQVPANTTYPNASPTAAGIAKLYAATGTATDGSMTQKSITDALNTKYSSTNVPPYPVKSVNTMTGAVSITAADVGAVPTTRKINGHVLSADFNITAADVGALASSVWVQNSASAAGYVPAGTGHNNMVWKTDGSGVPGWRADANTTYGVFGGATNDKDGTTGLVPVATKGYNANRYLKADGTWQIPPNTTYSTGNATTAGIGKLYTGTGTATDGSMTQKSITDALNTKYSSSNYPPQLATARAIGLSGDATGSANFNGTANATIPVTLATVLSGGPKTFGSNAAQVNCAFGAAITVPWVTVDAKGRTTNGGTRNYVLPANPVNSIPYVAWKNVGPIVVSSGSDAASVATSNPSTGHVLGAYAFNGTTFCTSIKNQIDVSQCHFFFSSGSFKGPITLNPFYIIYMGNPT